MATLIQPAFSAGELTPDILGRVDLAKFHVGCTTMRNVFANYRGGASSRAGTAFVGQCRQPGSALPPRDIPFQFSVTQGYALEFGDQYMCVKIAGAYVTEASKAITGISNANPGVVTSAAHGYSNGDWVFLTGIGGMTALNGQTFKVANAAANTFTLQSTITGADINTTLFGVYTSGGTAARIYTLTTPYAAVDVQWLKYTQSADVMSLTCVNQETLTEYPPYDLARVAANNWTLTAVTFATAATAPATTTSSASVTTASNATQYQFVVTSIDSATGQESIASPITTLTNSVDIAQTAGSITIGWSAVTGSSQYNIYKAPEAYNAVVPIGSQFGFLGSAAGLSFVDSNITADFTTVPPQHTNPFARGQVLRINITAQGSGYVQASTTVTITSGTGSGAVLLPVVVGGAVQAVIVQNTGHDYVQGDTVAIGGVGTLATATLTVGKATGTYPGCVSYFQQRRFYANTINNPDTYFASQPGAFKNMDTSVPTIASDAIVGTPWAQQVNGIQAMIPMPGGLVILTGLGAWQLTGGGAKSAVTPADQDAQPQAYNGCHENVPPIIDNYDILYVQQMGSIVRDLSYNFFANIYTGADMTLLSSHLFQNHQLRQWARANEPFKMIWCVRDDGILLGFTFVKEQEVYAWSRHDTNGLFVGVVSVFEPPVNAPYFIVKRYVQGTWVYYSERMDNRLWTDVESVWCVDCGLSYPMPAPAATLSASAASGAGVVFTADAAVFSAGDVGKILRMGGGRATITSFTNPTHLVGTLDVAITKLMPNDPALMPVPQAAGNWTLTAPVTVISGLNHLEGKTVAILADGGVVANQVVTNGTITLPTAASSIKIGLPFQAQVQTMPADAGQPTIQGKRKLINSITARVVNSRGIKIGANQPDASTQPFGATVTWGQLPYTKMVEVKERNNNVFAGLPIPLFTGDEYMNIDSGWKKPGQMAFQQDYPLPLNLAACIPNIEVGDSE